MLDLRKVFGRPDAEHAGRGVDEPGEERDVLRRHAENMADDAGRNLRCIAAQKIDLALDIPLVDQVIRHLANMRLQSRHDAEGERHGKSRPAPAMIGSVRGQHRIFEKIEQDAVLDAAKPGKFGLGLPRAGIGKELLHVLVAQNQGGAVTSLDERNQPPVMAENAVGIVLELVDRHARRLCLPAAGLNEVHAFRCSLLRARSDAGRRWRRGAPAIGMPAHPSRAGHAG